MIDVKSLMNFRRVYFHNNEISGSVYALQDAFVISAEAKLPVPNVDFIVYIHVYLGKNEDYHCYTVTTRETGIEFGTNRSDMSLYSFIQWLKDSHFSSDTVNYIENAVHELTNFFREPEPAVAEQPAESEVIISATESDISEDSEVSDNE